MQQRLAVSEQVFQLGGREVITGDVQGSLDDTDGECLATVAEIGHIATLCEEEFVLRVFTVGRNQTVEMVLHLLEVRLAVPESVIRVKCDYFDWQSGHIPLIIRLDDFFSKPLGSCTSGTSV